MPEPLHPQTKEYVANSIIESVRQLKRMTLPLNGITFRDYFEVDPDYDVHVVISLRKKKSQEEIGQEMFHGRSS